jgi:hypothetical protein
MAHQLLNIPGIRCPISGLFMSDPAILAGTGLSYERASIVAHLAARGTDPESGDPLDAAQQRLLPNPALKALIDAVLLAGLHDFAEQ